MAEEEDKLAGKAKEVAGKVTGDDELESEGTRQHAKGRTKEALKDAGDTAKGVAEGVKRTVSDRDRDDA